MAVADDWRHIRAQGTCAGRVSLSRWRLRGRCATHWRSHRHHAARFRWERDPRLQDSSKAVNLRAPSDGGAGSDAKWWFCAVLAVAPYEATERLVRPFATPLSPREADGCGLEGVGELGGLLCRLRAGRGSLSGPR